MMSSITWRTQKLWRDISLFGLSTAIRNSGRVLNRRTVTVKIPGFGSILVRKGDSDYDAVVQTLGRREYLVGKSVQDRINRRYQQILDAGKAPVIIDAGANIGISSIWFRSIYTEAYIVAIEPDPGNVEVLKRNVGVDPLITVVEAAVGSKAGFVKLVPNEKSWAVQTELADKGCPIVTIEQAVDMIPNGVPLLAKIDIEGFEKDLFSENLEWISRMFAIFVEPHDWLFPGQQSSRNFQRALGTGDFEIFLKGENIIYVRTE
jgi:FkbM family methyltransferase